MSLQWSALFGGLGLFLWGMHMLSQGLRLAAGAKLEAVLARATGTRWRGLVSGAVTTAIVQSSSAVTVATIGFVNASLLTLASAVWVLFGANLGTTATGWIVAFAGLKIDFAMLALPLIAAGAAMKLAGDKHRLSAWGEALAGFGMLFYGIVLMQDGFADLSAQWQIPQLDGLLGMAAQTLTGVVMTVIMQSSSASIAIALTAAQSGVIDITGAAAVVIGANIGTTVTAILASIGATPSAKRVAAAHVAFNLLTALAAFVVLPWLVPGIEHVLAEFGAGRAHVTTLAIFNTVFNALGVLLIWPWANVLVTWLQSRFAADVTQGAVPQFLDNTTLPVPGLAVRALTAELSRVWSLARDSMRLTLPRLQPASKHTEQHTEEQPEHQRPAADDRQHARAGLRKDLKRLLVASESFVDQMNRAEMDEATGQRLAALLRVRRYLDNVVEGEREIMALDDPLAVLDPKAHEALATANDHYRQAFEAVLGSEVLETDLPDSLTQILSETFEPAYQALKAALLKAGASGSYRLDSMEIALQRTSAQRRAVQQLVKAQQWLQQATEPVAPSVPDDSHA